MTTSFAQLSNKIVLYHSSSTFIVAKTCSKHSSVVTDHLAEWLGRHMSLGSGEKKNKTRCGSGGSRMRTMRFVLTARAEGGSIDLSKGTGPRAPVSWRTSSRTYVSPRFTALFQCPHSRVIKTLRVLNNNGNLRSVQACRALQNRARKEQVRFSFSTRKDAAAEFSVSSLF